MRRALVTGGAGFIGLHLARTLLARGVEVDLVDDFTRGVRDGDYLAVAALRGVRALEVDLLAPDALRGASESYAWIFHLAAIIGVANVERRPFEVLRDNQRMLFSVLDLARRQGALERLVFASTSEVVAGTLEAGRLEIPTKESSELVLPDLSRPRTSYMLSKLYGEALCRHSGLPFTIIRPHNVYGPRMGMAHVIPELLARAHRAPPDAELQVQSAEHTRTFCYVSDAVEIVARAAEADAGLNQVINVGASAPEVTMAEVAAMVCRAVGKSLRIVPGPVTPGSPARRRPDTSHAERITGYRATVELQEGIRRTYAWYAERGFPGESAS